MLQRRTTAALLALVIIASGSVASAAALNGGDSIANAPQLPLGVKTASGWALSSQGEMGTYGEFWRLQMNAGDQLVYDWAKTQDPCASGHDEGISVYAPNVTDYTVGQKQPVTYHNLAWKTKDEFRWVAPSRGNWIFFIDGCQTTSYTFIARLQAFTQIHLVAPSLVSHGRKVLVHGTVMGAEGGKVAVTLRGSGMRPTTKVVSLTLQGQFRVKLRFAEPGKYSLKATYYGDPKHRSSKASLAIHVA